MNFEKNSKYCRNIHNVSKLQNKRRRRKGIAISNLLDLLNSKANIFKHIITVLLFSFRITTQISGQVRLAVYFQNKTIKISVSGETRVSTRLKFD